ncbi:MAG: TIM barrel protein [Filifactor alocis]|nr:TIM barrel protein [Filifactor alocis]
MYRLISLVGYRDTLCEYKYSKDLEAFYEEYGLDGIELIRCGEVDTSYIRDEKTVGVHLPYYSDWMDFWLGKEERLLREYGDRSVWEGFYGGGDRQALLDFYKRDLDYAHSVGAKYVVFHVCNVSVTETFTRDFAYTDEEVIAATCEIVNTLMEGEDYQFEFLFENLYWRGLTFTSAEIARRLLEGTSYAKKGFMLDTGHMMCTNLDLKTVEEGVAYVGDFFRKEKDLVSYVRGIHLHKSISGDYVKRALKQPPVLKKDFYERFAQCYEHVFQIDRHEILTCKGTRELIEYLDPAYLVFEFRASNREDREKKLAEQLKIFL